MTYYLLIQQLRLIIWKVYDNNVVTIDKNKMLKYINVGSSFEGLVIEKQMVKKDRQLG
jgi:hypothetical protein